jgi:hypothetical protein
MQAGDGPTIRDGTLGTLRGGKGYPTATGPTGGQAFPPDGSRFEGGSTAAVNSRFRQPRDGVSLLPRQQPGTATNRQCIGNTSCPGQIMNLWDPVTQFLSHRSVRQSLRRCKPHLGIHPLALLGLTGIDYASNEQQYTRASYWASPSTACSCSASSTWAFRSPFPRPTRRFRCRRRTGRRRGCTRRSAKGEEAVGSREEAVGKKRRDFLRVSVCAPAFPVPSRGPLPQLAPVPAACDRLADTVPVLAPPDCPEDSTLAFFCFAREYC